MTGIACDLVNDGETLKEFTVKIWKEGERNYEELPPWSWEILTENLLLWVKKRRKS